MTAADTDDQARLKRVFARYEGQVPKSDVAAWHTAVRPEDVEWLLDRAVVAEELERAVPARRDASARELELLDRVADLERRLAQVQDVAWLIEVLEQGAVSLTAALGD